MPKNLLNEDFPPADLTDLDAATVRGPHLLLKVYPQEEKSAGGVELPEASQRKRFAAWVIGVGKGRGPSRRGESALVESPTSDFNIGDTVLCSQASLCTLPEIGEEVRYVYAEDVILHWKAKPCPKKS